MTASPFTKPRYKKVLITIVSLLIVAGAALGTITLLKHFAPDKMTDTVNEAATNTPPSLKKAEDLFAKGDYAGARAQYQSILDTYKSQKNEAAAKDIEMQLKVLDATAKAPSAPHNTDKGKVTVGSQPAQ